MHEIGMRRNARMRRQAEKDLSAAAEMSAMKFELFSIFSPEAT